MNGKTDISPDSPEKLAGDIEFWIRDSLPSTGRDVLKRDAERFAARARALAFVVPEVAATDKDGKPVRTGFYFEYPERQGYPISDGTPEEIPTVRCVAGYDPGDWGLANSPAVSRVTPPHAIVPTGRFVDLRLQENQGFPQRR